MPNSGTNPHLRPAYIPEIIVIEDTPDLIAARREEIRAESEKIVSLIQQFNDQLKALSEEAQRLGEVLILEGQQTGQLGVQIAQVHEDVQNENDKKQGA